MRGLGRLLATVRYGTFFCLIASSGTSGKELVGNITFPLGEVYIQREGSTDWKDVYLNMPAYEMDKVKTLEESRCEVTLTDRKVVRIGENTVFRLVRGREGEVDVDIGAGKAWINALLSTKGHLRVWTPTAVAAIRGTVYRLSCDSVYSNYRVYRGSIAVTPLRHDGRGLEDTTFYVNSGEELTIVSDFEEYKRRQEEAFKKFREREGRRFEEFRRRQREKFREFKRWEEERFRQFKKLFYTLTKFDIEEDMTSDWVKWNMERDRLLERGRSR